MIAEKIASACCVDIAGLGILILGDSGVGKTNCALSLVGKGFSFVADDVVRLSNLKGKLVARSDMKTGSCAHVRGIGILDVKSVWGPRRIKRKSHIKMAVEIISQRQKNPLPKIKKTDFLGIKIPHYRISGLPFSDPSLHVEILAMREKHRQSK